MIKNLAFISLLFFSIQATAVMIVIDFPHQTSKSFTAAITKPVTVASLSFPLFHDNEIWYQGTLSSLDELDCFLPKILEMNEKIYILGWCYRLDGHLGELPINKALVTNKTQELRWFYGYTIFNNGTWSDMCKPISSIELIVTCQGISHNDQ